MEEKTNTIAQRLKEKLAGSPDPVHAAELATELVESQLEAVSGGHASVHGSIDNQSPTENG